MSDLQWYAGIAIWLAAGWIAFAFFEGRAFRHKDRYNTLSRAVYDLGQKWPLSIFLGGFFIGGFSWGLAVHFYWHWCPPGSVTVGWLH